MHIPMADVLTIQLTPEDNDFLTKQAQKLGVNKSDIVRSALDHYRREVLKIE